MRDLVSQQLASISASAEGTAIAAAIVGLLLALWSASSAMSHLVEAINTAYDEDEGRSFVRRRGLSLVLTVGAIIFVVFALAVIAAAPAFFDSLDLGPVATVAAWIVRWLVLLGGMLVVLAILYRIAPDRDPAEWRWVSPGAIIATIVWLIASVLFSLYTSNFGSYNETYGSLAAVVVLMLWLLLTSLRWSSSPAPS
ncbi:MAG: YihY/virulence factor BrkB family protein [Ilumatobacteraceae bacterium]